MIKSWIFELPSIDLEVPATGPVYDWLLREWDRAEALNFEGIFLSEHHLPHYLSQSPNLLLAAMAMRTSNLRMGVMGLTAPMYHPSRLAEEIMMLDHLSRGRLEIGLARGASPFEVGLIGMPGREMQPRLLEALDIIEGALTANRPFNYDGHFYKCRNLIVPPTLQQPLPPRWWPTATPGSATLAARRGYKTCAAFVSADRIAENFDVYRSAAAASGRVVGPDDLGIRRVVIVDEDGDKARSHIKHAFRSFGWGEAPPPWLSRDEVVAGTPDEVARNLIDQCERTGAGHVLIYGGLVYGGWPMLRPVFEHTVELYGRDVLPRLRNHGLPRRDIAGRERSVG